MKKCFALFLSLALLLSCMPAAFAEEIGVVPYEIAALDTVIYIPENMTVTDETETDENVSVTLALNGREDCGFGINIGYSEAYEGYTMLTLPDDARQEMIEPAPSLRPDALPPIAVWPPAFTPAAQHIGLKPCKKPEAACASTKSKTGADALSISTGGVRYVMQL